MEKFNCLNSLVIIVILIAVVDASVIQCGDQNKSNSSCKADLESKIFGGWMGLSVGSFVGKEIFHHLSEKYPVKKERYLKYARYSRISSRCAALPVISIMTYVTMMAVGMGCMGFYLPDSIKQQLPVVAKLSTVPYKIMVSKPVDMYCNNFIAQKDGTEKTA